MHIDPKRERRINELIGMFFSAFDERSMPKDRFVSPTYDDPNLESVLRSVNRRDITPEFVQEIDLYPDDWMAFMTNEGRLHYLPVVMSLSVQELYAPEPLYGVMSESILGLLSPWSLNAPPHKWKELVMRSKKTLRKGLLRTMARMFLDEDGYCRHGGGNLLLSLEPREKHALKVYVSHCDDTCSQYPLFVYGIYETLDGRVDVGDGFSWLPKHEKIAFIDFIDYLTSDCREYFSREEIQRMLEVRKSKDLT